MDIVTMIDLHHGDCLDIMPTLEADSVDTVICDPPYGIRFMGRGWDHGVPGEPFWREALRVAKPGAMLLAFGGTRTFHRLACAIEDAGWELRDTVMWVYGSGFPKSRNIGKALNGNGADWHGWGTALKPAWEPVIVAMKPIDGTFAQNALQHGVAGLWIDGARVGMADADKKGQGGRIISRIPKTGINPYSGGFTYTIGQDDTSGRWPANLIHDGSDEVLAGFPDNAGGHGLGTKNAVYPINNTVWGKGWADRAPTGHNDTGSAARFFYCAKASRSERNAGLEGMEAREGGATRIAPTRKKCSICGCTSCGGDHTGHEPGQMTCGHPKAAIIRVDYDENSYHAKTPIKNHHPTVKPIALMRYLARLTKTPSGGVVLDPFMGSGSTGIGAVMEGRDFIGIEQDAEYIEIARRRIEHWQAEAEREAAQLELQFD